MSKRAERVLVYFLTEVSTCALVAAAMAFFVYDKVVVAIVVVVSSMKSGQRKVKTREELSYM